MFNKKGLSSIVSLSLLLLVSVVSVVSLQIWYLSYQSKTTTSFDTSNIVSFIDAVYIKDDYLYILNSGSRNISFSDIKLNSVSCLVSGSIVVGFGNISLNNCTSNMSVGPKEVVIVLPQGIYNEHVMIRHVNIPCVLNGTIVNSGANYSFFNSSYGFGACTSQSRICEDGVLNGDSNYNVSSCTIIYDLSCITDSDSDSFFNFSCAIYPMTNVMLAGHLDVNDSNSSIRPDMSCIFNDYKNSTSCLNNYIADGCGNGTVLDISTNLCWQRNMSSSGDRSADSGISNYCSSLSLAGSGWRVPTSKELQSIVDFSRSSPAVVGGNNNIFYGVQSAYYPTRGFLSGSNREGIYFQNGFVSSSISYGSNYPVVCVRGG